MMAEVPAEVFVEYPRDASEKSTTALDEGVARDGAANAIPEVEKRVGREARIRGINLAAQRPIIEEQLVLSLQPGPYTIEAVPRAGASLGFGTVKLNVAEPAGS
jgi:hypothetical protein